MRILNDLKQLYEIDEDRWLEETIELLKERQWEAIDLENLVEELEELGREKKNAVFSLLEQIISHFLLYQYWTTEREQNANHWEAEIYSFKWICQIVCVKERFTGETVPRIRSQND